MSGHTQLSICISCCYFYLPESRVPFVVFMKQYETGTSPWILQVMKNALTLPPLVSIKGGRVKGPESKRLGWKRGWSALCCLLHPSFYSQSCTPRADCSRVIVETHPSTSPCGKICWLPGGHLFCASIHRACPSLVKYSHLFKDYGCNHVHTLRLW